VVNATIHTAVHIDFLDPEQLLFRSSSSSVILTRLSGHDNARISSEAHAVFCSVVDRASFPYDKAPGE
jgi:hypothetical protein